MSLRDAITDALFHRMPDECGLALSAEAVERAVRDYLTAHEDARVEAMYETGYDGQPLTTTDLYRARLRAADAVLWGQEADA